MSPIYGIVASETVTAPPPVGPPPGNPARFISVGYTPDFTAPILFTTENDNAATWVDRSVNAVAAAPTAILQAIAYSASLDRWVAVGYESGNSMSLSFGDPWVIYSDDGGNTWAAGTPDPASNFVILGVCWTGAAFIAVGNDSSNANPRVMTSTDGIAWTARTSAPTTSAQWFGVSGFSGLAIAVGGSSGAAKIMSSANDGASWTARTPAANPNPIQGVVAVSGGTHVGVGSVNAGTGANSVATSTNGTSWTMQTVPTNNIFYAVGYNGSIYVAVGTDFSTNVEARIISSTNTTTWTSRTPDPSGPVNTSDGPNLLSVAAVPSGGFVAVGRDNNTFDRSYTMYSADGITWVARNAANSLVGPLFGVGARP